MTGLSDLLIGQITHGRWQIPPGENKLEKCVNYYTTAAYTTDHVTS